MGGVAALVRDERGGEVRADDGSMRRSRLALRAEAGAVVAKDTARIPNTLMFLTGRLKTQGDRNLAISVAQLFEMPRT